MAIQPLSYGEDSQQVEVFFFFNLPSSKLTYLAGKLIKIADIFPAEAGDFPDSHVGFKVYIMVPPSWTS